MKLKLCGLIGLVLISAVGAEEPHYIGARIDLGKNFNELSNAVVSEHVPWARPLPGGPVRALFLITREGAREAVELSQRVDMDYDAVLWHRAHTLGHVSTRMDIVGANDADTEQRLADKLSLPWDIIVMARVNFSVLPEWAQQRVRQLVEEGTALLYTFPESGFAETLSEATAIDLQSVWEGLPLAGLEPYRSLKQERAAIVDTLEGYQLGKGKVALLRYPGWNSLRSATLTPDLVMPHYEYHQALLSRLVLQLVGRPLPAGISVEEPERGTFRIGVRSETVLTADPVELSIRLREEAHGVEHEHRVILEQDGGELAYDYHPPVLTHGGHYLDVCVSQNGKRLGWISEYVTVDAENHITAIVLDKDHFESDEPVSGQIEFKNPPRPEGRVTVSIIDNHERTIAEEQLTSGSASSVAFSLFVANPLTVMHWVEVEFSEGGRVVDRGRQEFSIPDRRGPDDVVFIGWGGAGKSRHSACVWGKVMEESGLDAYSGGGYNAAGVRGPELCNMRKIPYAWRVGAHYPKQVKDGVREPCLTDPEYIREQQERFRKLTAECDRYGTMAYHLGDENYYILFETNFGRNLCFSPSCRAGFKQFLKDEYGTIEKLNSVWKTDYTDWESLQIARSGDFPEHNDAPASDHLLYLEKVFREAHEMAQEAICSVDPTARVGLEGLESLNATWGIDWYKLMRNFDLLCVYPFMNWPTKDVNRHCVRSFAKPGTLTGMWYGGYTGERYETWQRFFPWYSLFIGFNSVWWYDAALPGELMNALAPDFSLTDSYRQTTEEVRQIKSGIGKLVMGSQRQHDGIAVHYSYRSFIVDLLEKPRHFERRVGMNKEETAAFINIIEDLGLGFDMIATEQIEAGRLAEGDYRVLILPYSQSLTELETEAIAAFVRQGGTIVADYMTGVRDRHNVVTEAFAIDEVFGIRRDARFDFFRGIVDLDRSRDGIETGFTLYDREVESHVKTTTAEPLGNCNETFNCAYWNHYGRGKSLYLNFPVRGYPKDRYRDMGRHLREFFRDVFAAAGVRAPIQAVIDNTPRSSVRIARFRNEDATLVLTYRDLFHEDQRIEPAWLRFGESYHVYDVRTQHYEGVKDRVLRQLQPGRMEVFALLPYEVTGLQIVGGEAQLSAGTLGRFTFEVAGSSQASVQHVLRCEVFAPDGSERRHYGRNITTVEGRGVFTVPFALSDPVGRWTIKATDVISGKNAVALCQLSR